MAWANPRTLPTQIDEWMDEFDAEQEQKARDKQAAMGEDGWTVVVRAKVRQQSRVAVEGLLCLCGVCDTRVRVEMEADRVEQGTAG